MIKNKSKLFLIIISLILLVSWIIQVVHNLYLNIMGIIKHAQPIGRAEMSKEYTIGKRQKKIVDAAEEYK